VISLQAGCSTPGSGTDTAGNGNVNAGTGRNDADGGNAIRQETTADSTVPANDTQEKMMQEKIMEDFNALLGSNPKITELAEFMDANISKVSKENASRMVCALEEAQNKYLTELDGKFSLNESVQRELNKVYKPGFDINNVDGIQDKDLKELLAETRDSGFKVETAEGMYFPVINYEFHKRYVSYVTQDIKDYIDIMAVESGKAPAKDASLGIGGDEIIERAVSQEKFLKEHPGSARAEEVKKLYDKYVAFSLFGLNNTPLFSYETKAMDPEAITAYLNAVKSSEDSEYIKLLRIYMEVLAKNNYKLTDEVEKYRKANSNLNF